MLVLMAFVPSIEPLLLDEAMEKYNLLFERFLNPDRVSMPDIDIDFCVEGREKVIDYIKSKYGETSVAQIITFGTMKAKSSVRDVGRVMGIPYGQVDNIAKMIPNDPKMTLDKAMRLNKDLKKTYDESDTIRSLIDHSKVLEGMNRHASTHAAEDKIRDVPDHTVTFFERKVSRKISASKN